jgi:hypothetical protein
VSTLLGITQPPTRMDSQAKYCCLVRGEGGAYLRMPTGVGYREKIWVGLRQMLADFVHEKNYYSFYLLGPCTWPDPCGRSWWNSDRF